MRDIYNQHTISVLRKELSLIKKDYLELKKAIKEDTNALVSRKKYYQLLYQAYSLNTNELKNISKMPKDKVIDLLIKHRHNPSQLPQPRMPRNAQVIRRR